MAPVAEAEQVEEVAPPYTHHSHTFLRSTAVGSSVDSTCMCVPLLRLTCRAVVMVCAGPTPACGAPATRSTGVRLGSRQTTRPHVVSCPSTRSRRTRSRSTTGMVFHCCKCRRAGTHTLVFGVFCLVFFRCGLFAFCFRAGYFRLSLDLSFVLVICLCLPSGRRVRFHSPSWQPF